MMKRKYSAACLWSVAGLLVLAAAFTAVAAKPVQSNRDAAQERMIVGSVSEMLGEYPASTLQDVYKSFFQNNFGPEHIVADTASAHRYLKQELMEMEPARRVEKLYGLTAPDGRYVRVDLAVVKDGLVPEEVLWQAFLEGKDEITTLQIEEWKERWKKTVEILEAHFPDMPNFQTDKARIDSLLSTGAYAMHHSQPYERAYSPHYRIIRRASFERHILPLLSVTN